MPWPPRRRKSAKAVGEEKGFRSGLEETAQAQLTAAGIHAEYEKHVVRFYPLVKRKRYTPDFVLPNGIIVETKGRFVTADRQKHLAIKQQHPNLDIRFVFSNCHNKIGKGSQTSYAEWCEMKGFAYANKTIPAEWLNEPPDAVRIQAIAAAAKEDDE